MSYKNYLQQKISELQHEISEDRGEIEVLNKELINNSKNINPNILKIHFK